jgi:hypothetical protein
MFHVHALALQILYLRGAYALPLFKNLGRMLENGSPRVSIAESKTIQYKIAAVGVKHVAGLNDRGLL